MLGKSVRRGQEQMVGHRLGRCSGPVMDTAVSQHCSKLQHVVLHALHIT